MKFATHGRWLQWTAVVCAALLAPGEIRLTAYAAPAPQDQAQQAAGGDAPKLKSADELDSLVAPIALYPDPLLAQILAAATYPLEIVQCARWMEKNAKLKGEELAKAAGKQPWDPSVQQLVAFPDVVKLLDQNIQWTQDLGNSVLDQQPDVMNAVQRMRKKAKDGGKLESTKEQKVEVKTVEQKTVIEIVPSDPQVIYVPQYNPTVVYGAPPVAYAYPPVAYPWGAVAATAAVSFGVGMMMGAFWGGGGCCGYGANWGSANINVNNNFNRNTNIQGGNRTNIQGGNRTNAGNGTWQHNPQHRGNVPYSNRQTAQKFNGASRDSAGRTQRANDRGTQAGNRGNDRAGAGSNNRGADRGGAAANNRGADRGGAGGDRSGAANRSAGGGDRVGNRSVGSADRSSGSAFGGGSRAASDRGRSSTRSSGGGGGGGGSRSRGGGGGGGRRR